MTSARENVLPLMVALRVEGLPLLVVGGGRVATERVQSLLGAGARPRVIAPDIDSKLEEYESNAEITVEKRKFVDSDLHGIRIVFVAIDDVVESRRIAELARKMGVSVNVADRPGHCDFYFCAVHRQGPLQIAVSTNGQGPGLAGRIRDELADSLPEEIGRALEHFSKVRRSLMTLGDTYIKPRMSILRGLSKKLSWAELSNLALADVDVSAITGAATPIVSELPPSLGATLEPSSAKGDSLNRPTVHLVGAGPGDPDLLTLRAIRLIQEADLVLADRLIPAELLARVGGELRVADKARGRSETSQEQLNRWMVEGALSGRQVVRLKIGDPYLFGRGGEEVAELATHGIEVRVVPGIPSALAAPLAAGIPITMRGVADRVLVFTAAGQAGAIPIPPAYHPGTTFVALMGMGALPKLATSLVKRGFPSDLPAACIVNASRPDERIVTAPLSQLSEVVARAGLKPPGVLVFGAVAACALGANGKEALNSRKLLELTTRNSSSPRQSEVGG